MIGLIRSFQPLADHGLSWGWFARLLARLQFIPTKVLENKLLLNCIAHARTQRKHDALTHAHMHTLQQLNNTNRSSCRPPQISSFFFLLLLRRNKEAASPSSMNNSSSFGFAVIEPQLRDDVQLIDAKAVALVVAACHRHTLIGA